MTPEPTACRVDTEDLPSARHERDLRLVKSETRGVDGRWHRIDGTQDAPQRPRSEQPLIKATDFAQMIRVMSVGAMTASIAHELCQPLSGIITNASTCLRMLAADSPDVNGARETARRTLRDGIRASEVVTRLRALFVKREANTEPVDLNDAIQEVVARSSSELQRNEVVLRLELADHLPLVAGDRVQLQEVILNLLRNASDAMNGIDDQPRRLVIRTERDAVDQVRVSVEDVGVGLGCNDAVRIFEPFYTTKSEGMGIGLFISRAIIESHRGRIWATSNGSQGATVSFCIPSQHADTLRDGASRS